MNIATNPWTFASTDIASSTAAASPGGMIEQGTTPGERALGTVLYTSTAPHNLVADQFVTYISDTNGRFNGFYRVVAVPSATTALLQNISSPTSGRPFDTVLAASGGGTMLLNQIQQNLRGEDLSIQAGPAAAQTAGEFKILDRNGILTWTGFLGATPTNTGSLAQNRGKLMWVDGVTLQALPAGYTAVVTIN